ncbi:MAG: hypothetical protein IPK79_08865 [Vampirovibrionales bacterium]|nr:hypothetical protein [Vampirovibrionales bacterium]
MEEEEEEEVFVLLLSQKTEIALKTAKNTLTTWFSARRKGGQKRVKITNFCKDFSVRISDFYARAINRR